jgi:competence protein ComEC
VGFVLSGGTITNNTATSIGGTASNGGDVLNSSAGGSGGNSAANGGGIHNTGTDFVMSGGSITNNAVNSAGGAGGNGGSGFQGYSSGGPGGSGVASGGGICNVGADFTLSGGTVASNTLSGAGGAGGNGGNSMHGSLIDRSDGRGVTNGGGIYNSGTGSVSNCIIENNSALGSGGNGLGGGIYNTGSEFALSNCTIVHNTAIRSNGSNSFGGGIYNTGDSFRAINCTIARNIVSGLSGSGFGGGIANSGIGFVLSNCTIANNIAHGNSASVSGVFEGVGGGIYNTGDSFRASNSTITSNTASGLEFYLGTNMHFREITIGRGGGIANSGAGFVLSNCTITSNTANGEGGGIANSGAGFVLSNCILSGNTAKGTNGYSSGSSNHSEADGVYAGAITSHDDIGIGGGIVNTGADFTILNCVLTNNTARDGGGVANFGRDLVILNSALTYNTVQGVIIHTERSFNRTDGSWDIIVSHSYRNSVGSGGGIYNNGGSSCVVINCILSNNVAWEGGGIYLVDGTVKLYNSIISTNTASHDGGGIWVALSGINRLFVYDGVVFSNNCASVAYNRSPLHDATYHAQIGSNVVWTTPFIQGYNNYDISYTTGSLFTFTVTYDANGGSGSGRVVVLTSSDLLYGSQHMVLSAEEADVGTKEGYIFAGWNTEKDGSGLIGGVRGNFIPEQHTFTATDITLYAQWVTSEIDPIPKPDTSDPIVLDVIFFDVGQADCILLKTDNHTMLIDAGNTGQDQLILNYLAEYNITTIDYLVATHPHADHIGSMTSVLMSMDYVGTVIMPDKPHTTQTYENLIKAIEEKDISLIIPNAGYTFELGSANIEVLAPNADYTDLNECSLVLRVEFGDIVFLFTGDAGTSSEQAQLANGFSLKADVLKVGHHGSRTSSTQQYLNAVAPSYAVICCGAGNTYGHPHSEAMTRLTGTGAVIYRTDENGTIIFTTDGESISVSTVKGAPGGSTSSPGTSEEGYIGNKNSKVFHLPSCLSLPQEQNRVYFNLRQDAIDAGYTPCGNCKP